MTFFNPPDTKKLTLELIELDNLYAESLSTKKHLDTLELKYRERAFEIRQILDFAHAPIPEIKALPSQIKPLSIDLIIITVLNDKRGEYVHIDDIRAKVASVKNSIHFNTISSRLNLLKKARQVFRGKRGYWMINPNLKPDERETPHEFI